MLAGIDEVGRGALAGPVVVGAVAQVNPGLVPELVADAKLKRLRDSKQLSAAQRERAYQYLEGRIMWSVGRAEAAEIDSLGIVPALTLAAGRAIDALTELPTRIVADAGLEHPYEASILTERFVKGDENILEITLASIMAKVWRDRLMQGLAELYPAYGFEKHAGYGTSAHFASIRASGLSPQHRRSFTPALYL